MVRHDPPELLRHVDSSSILFLNLLIILVYQAVHQEQIKG